MNTIKGETIMSTDSKLKEEYLEASSIDCCRFTDLRTAVLSIILL